MCIKNPNITFKKYWGTTIFSNTSAKIKVIIDLQHEIYTPVDTMFHSEAGTLEMPEVTKYFADTVAYIKSKIYSKILHTVGSVCWLLHIDSEKKKAHIQTLV